MDAAHTIREAVARVSAIRRDVTNSADLRAALVTVKALQAKRFSATYSDMLHSKEYGPAARFFLEDLYSDKDYSQRDAQFARIAGALQRLFPQQVLATAVSLAQLHLLTEELDWKMAAKWSGLPEAVGPINNAGRYITCWRSIGCHDDRTRQLEVVLGIGKDLDRLTCTPGLRLMLRMMRGPAKAAGLGSLQDFLESGFDTFSNMSGKKRSADQFLGTISSREASWIQKLSFGGFEQCESDLKVCLSIGS